MIHRVLTLAVGIAMAFQAGAQAVITIEAQTQATVVAPGGRVKGCGLRVSGITPSPVNSAGQHEAIDLSLNIYENFGLLKAGVMAATMRSPSDIQTLNRTVEWMRVNSAQALTPIDGKIMDSDSPGFQMFGVAQDAAARTLSQMLAGGDIWISFKDPSGPSRIYSGKVQTTPDVDRQINSCLDAFMAEIKRR